MFYSMKIGGDISLEKLKEISKARIFLLHNLAVLDSVEKISDFIVENWNLCEEILTNDVKDGISHNMLTILAVIEEAFRPIFMKGERRLFMYRLSFDWTSEQINQSFQELHKHLVNTNSNPEVLKIIVALLENNFIEHYFTKHRKFNNLDDFSSNVSITECDESFVSVPFHLLPKLVATRSVIIKSGIINLQCFHHEHLMREIFNILLEDKLKSYVQNDAYVLKVFNKEIEDQRTLLLFKTIKNYDTEMRNLFYTNQGSTTTSIVNMANIASVSALFPKCMKNIYTKLDGGEKLSHGQRYNFSLFLKDVGMDIQEANLFWRKYYSKIKGNHTTGSIWDERKYRYSYSLQHLYGQAGSRRQYSTSSCSKLFSSQLCAFPANADIEDLGIKLSQGRGESFSMDNLSSQQDRRYVACCAVFENHHDKFSSPLQLYHMKYEKEKDNKKEGAEFKSTK